MYSCTPEDLSDLDSELRLLLELQDHALKIAKYAARRMTCRPTGLTADKSWREHYERLIGHNVKRVDQIMKKLETMEERSWNSPLREHEWYGH